MVPAIKGSEGLDFAGFHSYYEELITKTRENKLTADDFQGTNISLTNPGGIGTVASVPRLMSGQSAIIATGAIAYPPEWAHATPERLRQIGVSKTMTLTSTYDHRVIQGAESGAFLRSIEQLLQGEDGFYESVAADLGIDSAPISAAHPASASAPPLGAPAASTAEAGGHHHPARRGAAAGGAGRDLAAQGLPHPRPPRRPPRPARPRAQGRPGDPAGDAQPDPGADVARAGLDPAHRRPRRDPAGGAAADARGLLRHDRLPVRAPLLAPAAHLAARDGRDRRPPRAARRRGETAPADAADRRLPVRALHREGLPGAEDLHDRGARRGRADARRAGHARPPQRRRGGRLRHGPPRPPRRPRPQPRPLGRVDPGRVRGLQADRPGQGGGRHPARRHRRRQVPLRPPGGLRDARGREDRRPPLPQPEPPRVRQPGGRGRDPLDPVRLRGPGDRAQAEVRGAGAAARRRRLPRPGRGRRDAQPAGAEGLHHRRHDPRHPEQPGGLHHRPRGRPLDPLRGRHGEGLQRADRPRQRRRRRSLLRRDAPGDGLPRALGPRHRHRRDRLPPLRPQRDRRARLHAAADRRQDQGPPAGLRDLRRAAGRGGRAQPRGGRRRRQGAPRRDVGGAEGPAPQDGAGRLRGPDGDHDQHRRARPQRQPAGARPRCRPRSCAS